MAIENFSGLLEEWVGSQVTVVNPESYKLTALGYDDSVSYDKGCYVGQEIVARIRTYGHVNQLLRRLRFEDRRCPARDAGTVHAR